MCLLAVLHRVHPEAPLVVAANRDEWLARPASAARVLRAEDPRVLGGRDELAGGTWLAVNRQGVVAGLTNQPSAGGRDGDKRSRGELPLLLATRGPAAEAAAALAAEVRCEDYNPCWILVGDRSDLFYAAIEGEGPPHVERLEPGVHVLENRPLRPPSPKALRVRSALAEADGWSGDALLDGLAAVLRDHTRADGTGDDRPPGLEAACVHAGPYGTRSASLTVVPPDDGPPRFLTAEGPPCESPFTDQEALWTAAREV